MTSTINPAAELSPTVADFLSRPVEHLIDGSNVPSVTCPYGFRQAAEGVGFR